MAPTLTILGVTAQTYPLALILAAVVGMWVVERMARRSGLDADAVNNLVFYALLATVLGARLAFVLTHWVAYRNALLSAFSLTLTALSWPGGLAIGCLVALAYWRRHPLPVGATVDVLAPGLTAALAVERLGAFLNGSDLGTLTTSPWGVVLWDEVRHPVGLYEMAVLLLILGILWWAQSRKPFAGYTCVLFVALYAGARLFLEAYRAQTLLFPGGVRVNQVAALTAMLGAVWYLYRRRFSPPSSPDHVALEQDLG